MTRLERTLATWFGAGHAPVASGTAGTAAAMPLVGLLWLAGSDALHAAAAAAITLVGVWSARRAEQTWGRKDPGQVVIDEVAGYLVATLAIPASWTALAVTFFLFRLFDVVKPPPARRLEQLPGAWGIMVDDLVAGLYANLAWRLGAIAWDALGR